MMHFDFMGRKYLWFAISGVIIVAGLVSLFTKGLNESIDFKGGDRLVASFDNTASVGQVRDTVSGAGFSDPVVQTLGNNQYQITLAPITIEDRGTIEAALNGSVGGLHVESWNSVGPTFGSQVLNSMLRAVLIAWGLIIIYVSFRFEYKMAVATLVALVHDLIITVGVYSITGREVTTATIAAVLTILGYSLYDTIIVFDRIRENTPRTKRGGYSTMVNESIWEVMNRSIITTMLTLLPVVCLFIFGGETLKDFAFALIVGVTSGAYSSIFVAAPLLTLWKERERQYRPGAVKAGRAGKTGRVAKAKAR